jgi:AcrR family transcriptional regulator
MSRPPNPQLIKLIQNIVAEEIQVKGIEGVTVRLVAERAGISATTIYYYFKNKEELFDKLKFSVARELDEYIFNRISRKDSPEKQFRELIDAFIDWSVAHPKLLDLVFDTLPPKTNLTEDEMAQLYHTQNMIIELIEQAAAKNGVSLENVKADSSIFIGLAYGVVKLFLNKRFLPEYWEDITPLKEKMYDFLIASLKSQGISINKFHD